MTPWNHFLQQLIQYHLQRKVLTLDQEYNMNRSHWYIFFHIAIQVVLNLKIYKYIDMTQSAYHICLKCRCRFLGFSLREGEVKGDLANSYLLKFHCSHSAFQNDFWKKFQKRDPQWNPHLEGVYFSKYPSMWTM